MALSPISRAPERIGVMGIFGTGKTRNLLSIAAMAQKTKSEAQFWMVDTDFGAWRSLDEFPGLDNVHVYEVGDWPEYEAAADDILANCEPARNDWISYDLAGAGWTAVQDHFTEQVFGMDAGGFFLEARKSFETTRDQKSSKRESFNVFDGWIDWQVINRMYRTPIQKLYFKSRCHVYVATGAEKLVYEGKAADSKEDRMLYGSVGVKPVGQKHTGHQMHTLLLATHATTESWTLTTVKDRGHRRYLEGEPVRDFSMDYLRKVAGWTL